MTWDYETIKKTAKENGITINDLLALAPANDPFYVGSKTQMENARWFNDIYTKMGRPPQCHIRRTHYWLISQPTAKKPDGTLYENTTNDWNFLALASKYARYANLVPTDALIDRRNPDPIINIQTWENEIPTDFKDSIDSEAIIDSIVEKFYIWNPHKTQPYHLELWCEKSTMNDVLEPIGKEWGINVITGLGELSITSIYDLIKRIDEIEKPTRIFYISDFDPAGECMPVSVARKIEYYIDFLGIEQDVKLKQLMLTSDQCKRYKLPRTPIKEKEKRKAGFETRHGTGATELDALEALYPGDMKKIILGEIAKYFDVKSWNEVIQKNKEVQSKISEFLEDKIEDVLADLDISEYDDYEPPTGEKTNDFGEWLYDTDLDYMDQMARYKKWRNKTSNGGE